MMKTIHKRIRGKRHRHSFRSDSRKHILAVESLEDRRLLVVGAFDIPDVVPVNGIYDGIVRTGGGTGSLLNTGRHILTAEHVGDDFEDSIPRFELLTPIGQIRTIRTPIAESFPHPDVDLKVHELAELAPLTVRSWDINRDADEVGRQVTLVGYGDTGTGTTGNVSEPSGTLSFTTEVVRLTIDSSVSGGFFLLSQEGGGGVAQTLPHDPTANQIKDAVLALTGAHLVDVRLVGDIAPFNNGIVEHTSHPYAGSFEIVIAMADGDVDGVEASDFEVDNLVVSDFAIGGNIRLETLLEGGGRREKRLAYNQIGLADNTWLYSDFDNGTSYVDSLGLEDGLGLGVFEGFHTRGDSGSPVFIDGLIAGVHKGRLGDGVDGIEEVTADFGERERYARVSTYQYFIDPILQQSYPLVLDMNNQPWGNDGWDDTIEFSRNGSMLEISVGGTVHYSDSISKIESVTLRGSSDNETINFSALGNAIPVQILGRGGDDTIRLDGLSTDALAIIQGGAGADRVVVGNRNFASNIKGNVWAYGESDDDSLILSDRGSGGSRGYGIREDEFSTTAYGGSFRYFDMGTVELRANDDDNSINVFGTAVGTNVIVNGNEGADDIYVGDGDINANIRGISLRVVGGLGHDRLFLDHADSNAGGIHNLGPKIYEVYSSQNSAAVDYFTTNEVHLDSGSGREIINIQGTSQFTHDVYVNTRSNMDEIRVHATHANTTLHLDTGSDSDRILFGYTNRDLDAIKGRVNVNMRTGVDDKLSIFDELDTGNDTYNLWSQRFDKSGFNELNFGNVDTLELHTNELDNTINVRELHSDVQLSIYAGDGNDRFRLGFGTEDLDSHLLGNLSIYGQEGQNAASFYDWSDTGSDVYRIDSTQFSKTATQVWEMRQIQQLVLHANDFANHVHVGEIVGENHRLRINTRDGNDEVFLGTIDNQLDQLKGEIFVNGGSGFNKIHALDRHSEGGRTYTFDGATLIRRTTSVAGLHLGCISARHWW